MDLNLSEDFGNIIAVFILLVLPLLLLLIGVIIAFNNALFYILSVFWFGMGIIFYGALFGE